jgi:hypothetical protein
LADDHQDAPDIELAAKVEAAQLRFQEVPQTEIRFSGTPDYESSTMSRRRNLPDPVSEQVDYHDVLVDYVLANRLKTGNPAQNRQQNAGSFEPELPSKASSAHRMEILP